MPVSTVGGILRRLGLGRLSALEPKPPVVRYQRERPGELIHIDTKKLGRIEAIGHRITGDRRDSKRGAGWEAVHVCIDDASRLADSEVLAGRAQDQRRAVPRARGRLVRAPGHHGRAGHDRQRFGLPKPPLGPGLRRARVASPPHPAVHAAHQRQGRALHPDQPARMGLCAPLCDLARARRRADALGSTITTPPGRTPPWPTSRRSAVCAKRRSSVRPTDTVPPSRPVITHDRCDGAVPGAPQATGASRREASLRRPAGPVTLRTGGSPNARSPEQRSWKQQLGHASRSRAVDSGVAPDPIRPYYPVAWNACSRRARWPTVSR